MRGHKGPPKKETAPRRGPGQQATIFLGGLLAVVAVFGCSSGGGSGSTLTITPDQYSMSPEQTREFRAVLWDSEGLQVANPTISWTLAPAGWGTLVSRHRQTEGPVIGEQVQRQMADPRHVERESPGLGL